jgi:hypothetical protein
VANNFQTEKNNIKLLKEYESATQKVSFSIDKLAALMSGRKYNGQFSYIRLKKLQPGYLSWYSDYVRD